MRFYEHVMKGILQAMTDFKKVRSILKTSGHSLFEFSQYNLSANIIYTSQLF